MPVTSFSPLLGLALPTTGDLSGTWGTTVNDSITSLLDTAVAGTTTLSTDTNVTLSTTNGAANQARSAVLLCTGARTALRTITAPAQSKAYVVINQTTGGFGVQVVGAGPTTGVTIANGDKALIAWNGSDFTVISSTSISNLTGTLPVTSGGTGQTTYTNGQLLIGNTTGNTLTKATLTAGSGISVTNGAGSITIAATGGTGTVTNVGTSGSVNGLTLTGGPITSTGTVTLGGGINASTISTGTLPVANGGTGVTSAGSSGNVLTSNGTAWVSQAAAGGANVQSFTSGGTWTKPSGAQFVYVEVWGAGAGGQGGVGSPSPTPNNGGGTGGGGGGYSSQYFLAPQLGATETVTIGAGGSGGPGSAPFQPANVTNSTNGGASNFGTYVYAYGGQGRGPASPETGAGGFAWAPGVTMNASNGSGTLVYLSYQVLGGQGQFQNPTLSFNNWGVFGGGVGGVAVQGNRDGSGSFYGGGGGGAGTPGVGDAAGAGGIRQRGSRLGGGGAGGPSGGGNGTPGPATFAGGGGGSGNNSANGGNGGSGNTAAGGGGGGGAAPGSTGGSGASGGSGLVVVYSW